MPHPWAIIGATGRLGRALSACPGTGAVVGLARNQPATAANWASFIRADRSDHDALCAVLEGAAVVVDLCAFDSADADGLIAAWQAVERPPRLLVFASSLAERPLARWSHPESELAADQPPEDSYGLGKRAARLRFEQGLPAPVLSLLLPSLICPDDSAAAERRYLDDARRLGHALVPGSGDQRPAVATVAGVAELLVTLAGQELTDHIALQVAPGAGPTVAELVEALLGGAGLPPKWQGHPDPGWRGPHSGADEVVDASALQRRLPAFAWPDPLVATARLGAHLAAAEAPTP